MTGNQVTAYEPPRNIEAEQALLGAILGYNDALDRIPELEPAHFYEPLHADIFKAIRETVMRGQLANGATIAPRFRGVEVGDLTGQQYVQKLVVRGPQPISAREYARVIIEAAQLRALVLVGESLIDRAVNHDGVPPSELIEEAERTLFLVADRGKVGREVTLADAAKRAIAQASAAYQRNGKIIGLSTGFIDLDKKLGGLAPGNLIVLGARPSMGKTALATSLAYNVASGNSVATADGELADPQHVHFFSQEMTADELATRIIAEQSEVSSEKLRRGEFDDDEFRKAKDAAELIGRASFTVDETGGITIASLTAKARRIKRKHKTSLIVVDYLQLMQGARAGFGGNRVQDLTEITTGLKALAKELEVPVIALSQLSRGVESRDDKRPMLSDLRESGSIEQDADVVLFLYRDEYYVERRRPADEKAPEFSTWQQEFLASANRAEVIIAKQRHGPIGTVPLMFHGEFTRFSNAAREDSQKALPAPSYGGK